MRMQCHRALTMKYTECQHGVFKFSGTDFFCVQGRENSSVFVILLLILWHYIYSVQRECHLFVVILPHAHGHSDVGILDFEL
jgi:hypothetical protein